MLQKPGVTEGSRPWHKESPLTIRIKIKEEHRSSTQGGVAVAIREPISPGKPLFRIHFAQNALELLKCDQHAVAEEMLRECLAIRENAQADVWSTFNSQSMLGGALLGQQKYADAEPVSLQRTRRMIDRRLRLSCRARSTCLKVRSADSRRMDVTSSSPPENR